MRFRRQKAVVNRKYGHDTQGVTGSSPVRPTKVPSQKYFFGSHFGKIRRCVIVVSNAVSNVLACGLYILENICP